MIIKGGKKYFVEIFAVGVYCMILFGLHENDFFSYRPTQSQTSQVLFGLVTELLLLITIYSILQWLFHSWKIEKYSLIFPVLSGILLSYIFSNAHSMSGVPIVLIIGYFIVQQLVLYSVSFFLIRLISGNYKIKNQ